MPESSRPFPEVMREEAHRIALRAGALRARVRVASSPYFALPDEHVSDSWVGMLGRLQQGNATVADFDSWRRRVKVESPPQLLVEAMTERFAYLIETVARQGYYRERVSALGGDRSVLAEAWPALHATELLSAFRPSREARARLDESIALLQRVLDDGVRYYQAARPGYDEVTAHYQDLVTCLYDFRASFTWSLRDGALLLHGGTEEARLLVAREIHYHRLTGFEQSHGGRFLVIGAGEARITASTEYDTVYVPDPIALSDDEQAALYRRVALADPQPTILGTGDREQFATLGRARLRDELQKRLFRSEYHVGLEDDTP
jgi:hypothetical protein